MSGLAVYENKISTCCDFFIALSAYRLRAHLWCEVVSASLRLASMICRSPAYGSRTIQKWWRVEFSVSQCAGSTGLDAPASVVSMVAGGNATRRFSRILGERRKAHYSSPASRAFSATTCGRGGAEVEEKHGVVVLMAQPFCVLQPQPAIPRPTTIGSRCRACPACTALHVCRYGFVAAHLDIALAFKHRLLGFEWSEIVVAVHAQSGHTVRLSTGRTFNFQIFRCALRRVSHRQ